VPPHELERVFAPFYRLEASRSRSTGGAGLGLAVARDIARAHGGDVVLVNRPGGGLRATLSLPR
jgi:signal transduction histidine kinase